jgi:hypothetical protein
MSTPRPIESPVGTKHRRNPPVVKEDASPRRHGEHMSNLPPTADAVRQALIHLGREGDLEVALHLALPRPCPHSAVERRDGHLHWRGNAVPQRGSVVDTAVEMAIAGRRDDDQWLDLDAGETTWVKWVESGTRWYAHGPGFLYDGPTLTTEGAVPDGVRQELIRMTVDRKRPSPPFVISTDNGSCLVAGDSHTWHAVADSCPPTPPPGRAMDRETLCHSVVDKLGGTIASLDEDRVVVTVQDTWLVDVPVRCFERSALIGVTAFRVGDLPDPSSLPVGYEAVGFDGEGQLVVCHLPSGIRGVLTRKWAP